MNHNRNAAESISYPSAHSIIGLKPTAVLWDMYTYCERYHESVSEA